MTPGKRIRSRRRFRRMTQQELGEKVGLSSGNIKAIEHGQTDPRFHVMVKICDELKLDIMDMVRDVRKGATEI